MIRRPNLFIVGAPKCGTTSLYEYLKGHPEVFMSPDKEPRYFAPDLIDGVARDGLRYGEDLGRYLALFAEARDEKRLGEASARYVYSLEAPRLIRDFEPDARIVVMLRDPVDMIHSLHGYRVSKGNEDIADFEEALDAEPERREGRRIPHGTDPRLLLYRDWVRFADHLPRWFDTFGREAVHVIILEDLTRESTVTFRRLLQFLDVDPDYQPPAFAAHNPSHRPRSTALRALLYAHGPRRVLREHLPVTAQTALKRLVRPLRRLNRKPTKRSGMRPELRRELEGEFAPDVARLSEMLGRDLAALWWKRDRAAGPVLEEDTEDVPVGAR